MRAILLFLWVAFYPYLSYGSNLFISENNFDPAGIPATDVKIADIGNTGQNNAVVLAVGRHNGGQSLICFFKNNQFDCSQKIGYANSPTIAVGIGNFDDDDKVDIVLANGDCHYPEPICKNQPAALLLLGSDNYSTPYPLTQATGARSLAVGDINGDGLDDIALGFAGGQNSLLLINSGSKKFQPTSFPNLGSATLGMIMYKSLQGRSFLITTSRALWRSEDMPHKNGVFAYIDSKITPISTFGENLQSVDAAIGRLDLSEQNYVVVTNGGEPDLPGQHSNIWPISANGIVSDSPIDSILSQQANRSRPVVIYDLNNDGLNDIVIGNLNEPGISDQEYSYVYVNQGNLSFLPVQIPNPQLYEPRGMDVGSLAGRTFLFSANYCVTLGDSCYSKFYTFDREPAHSP